MKRDLLTFTVARVGHTLVELMVAMLAASILMAGLSSSIFIALKATDTRNTPTTATLEGHAALTDLMADLEFATTFTEQTATAVTFVVADRDGDGSPETIRYAWSGTAGDPLTRQYNGGAAAAIVDNIHVFQLDAPTPTPNLLSNADMEAGTTGWSAIPNATMHAQSDRVHGGLQSLYAYRNTGNDESGLRQLVTSQLSVGTPYVLQAWMMKWAAPAPFDVKLQLHLNSTGGGDQVFSSESFVINNANFVLVQGTVTPTWSGTLLSAYWEATGVSKIQDIYVDDAVLRVMQTVRQNVNVNLQVGSDTRSLIQSGVLLRNSPL